MFDHLQYDDWAINFMNIAVIEVLDRENEIISSIE